MFGGLFRTWFGRILAAVVAVAGATGGLAAAGAVPLSLTGNSTDEGPPAPAVASALLPAGAPLTFPDLPIMHQAVFDQDVQDLATNASAEAVAIAVRAQTQAQAAADAAQKCLEELNVRVNALLAGIPGIATAEQAEAVVHQARTIADAATACAGKATALGQSGVDQITKAAGLLNEAMVQVASLDLTATSAAAVEVAQETLGTATKTVDQASGNAFGMFKQIADIAAAMMATPARTPRPSTSTSSRPSR